MKPVHHLALLSYCYPLLAKRRVLLLSDDFSMASFIQETGAHQVIAISAEAPASPWPSLKGRRGMAYQVMPYHDLQFADDAFDAVVVPDLSLFTDPAAVIAELERVVDPAGYLMISAPNPDAGDQGEAGTDTRRIDYYQLYELLAERFPSVQMIGESPFVGYTVADLSCEEDDIEVSFDSDLVGEETSPIAWFVAVSGQVPAALEPLSVIQIPEEAYATSQAALDQSDGLKSEIAALAEALAEAKRELGNRGVRIESLGKTLEEELRQSEDARARAVKLAKELDNERKERTKRQLEDAYQKRSQDIDLQTELREVKKQLRLADERSRSAESARDELIETIRSDAQELDRRREKQTQLEEKLHTSQKRAQSLADELQALKARLADGEHQLEEANRLRAEANRQREEANQQREEANQQREEANQRLEEVNRRLEETNRQLEDTHKRLGDADKQLASSRVSDTDHTELAKEITALGAENAALENQLKEIARQKTEQEAELMRQNAIVRDLAVRLDSLTQGSDVSPPSAIVEALEIEISALRGARAGHHRARVEAELELSSAVVSLEDARGEIAALNLQLNERDVALAEVREALAAHETIRAALEADIAHTKEALSSCEQRLAEYKAQTVKADAEISENAKRSNVDDLKMAELAGDLQSARWRVDELEARNSALAKRIETLSAEASAVTDERRHDAESHAREMGRQQQAMHALAVSYSNSMESVNALHETLCARVSNAEEKDRELTVLSDANKKLSALLEALERRERMVEEEVERQTERAKRLREDLDAAVSRNKLLEAEMAGARADRERLEQDLGELTRRVDETAKEMEQANTRAREAEATAESVVARATAAEVELTAAQDAINGLERKMARAMSSETEQVQQVQDELSVERIRVAELRERLERAENRLAEEVSRNDGLRAAVEVIKAELEAELNLTRMAGADAARISGEAVAIKKKLAKSHRVIEEKDLALETTVNALAALRAEVVVLSGKLEAAQEERCAGEDRCEKLTAEVDELKVAAASLAAASERREQALAAFEDKTRSSEEKLKASEDILSDAQASIAEKASEIATLKEQVRLSSERLKESESDINEAHAAVADMEAKIVAINQSKVGMSMELADAIQHVERLESDLAGMGADGEKLKAEMDALTQRLATAEAAGAEVSALKMKLEEADTLGLEVVELKLKLAQAEIAKAAADALKHRLAATDALMAEKEALVGSLTEQLEERERRAAKLERKNRALDEQVREHESDVAAWNSELKLRNARILQLEREIQALEKK